MRSCGRQRGRRRAGGPRCSPEPARVRGRKAPAVRRADHFSAAVVAASSFDGEPRMMGLRSVRELMDALAARRHKAGRRRATGPAARRALVARGCTTGGSRASTVVFTAVRRAYGVWDSGFDHSSGCGRLQDRQTGRAAAGGVRAAVAARLEASRDLLPSSLARRFFMVLFMVLVASSWFFSWPPSSYEIIRGER